LFIFLEGCVSVERTEFLEVLKNSYSAYYNIIPQETETDLPLIFRADYSSRDERYWVTKKIKIWANEKNEYAYIFSAESFDSDMVDRCVARALEESLPRVKPHSEHQYSNVKTLFVADSFDKDTIKHIQKLKFEKSYKHSLHGFTMLKAAAVDLSREEAYPNAAAYELTAYFKKLFAAGRK
jgi:hypothetical protein